ncbi:MAG: AAA family ATPase [Magnetococcales bacterium]|nr:AAA family ATPase [Magnetococcales bacterium]
MSIEKKIVIIVGPNGAGKTTFAREFLPNEAHCPIFVNADLIAAGLSPFAPELAAVRAARLMLQTMAEHVAAGRSFAFETTLSGKGYARVIPQWRAMGYHVKLIFLDLPDVETSLARVAERVRQGGHDVPEETVRRRFVAGRRNLIDVYRSLVDTWLRFDHSGDHPRLLNWSGQ